MEKKTLKEWWSERPKKQKYLIIIGVLLFIIIGNIINTKPSACGCIENLEIGYYDALNENDRKMRDKCNEAYAGDATLYIECQKEKGKWDK
jgi:hypothetical protein